MKITGTMVNYFVHCKRQCYLFSNQINLEDNEEAVHIGRAIHEQKQKENKNTEIELENIKIDRISKEYLTEIKKSDSDQEAAKWQMYYYLYVLKKYGIERKGRLEFVEKNKKSQPIIEELNEEIIDTLEKMMKEIKCLVQSEHIPEERLSTNKCKKCAYYSYCYL